MGYVARRYFKTVAKASNHARYIAYRSRYQDQEKKGLFNEREDNIKATDFTKQLDCKLTSHPSVAVAHTLLFSMSGDEFNRSKFEYGDYRKIVRNVMRKYELEKGIKLNWGAAEHFKPNNPHCHVIIKSTFLDRDGVEHRLKLTKEDVEWFRKGFEAEKESMRGFSKEDLEITRRREWERNRSDGTRKRSTFQTDLLDAIVFQIQRKAKEKEFEQEREQERGR